MKVYAIKGWGRYGGGMSIVAAVDEEQAKKLASAAECSDWHVRYDKPDSVTTLPLTYEGSPKVLEHYETGE